MAVSIRKVNLLGDGTVIVNMHIGKESYLNEQHLQLAFFNDQPILCETLKAALETKILPETEQFRYMVNS